MLHSRILAQLDRSRGLPTAGVPRTGVRMGRAMPSLLTTLSCPGPLILSPRHGLWWRQRAQADSRTPGHCPLPALHLPGWGWSPCRAHTPVLFQPAQELTRPTSTCLVHPYLMHSATMTLQAVPWLPSAQKPPLPSLSWLFCPLDRSPDTLAIHVPVCCLPKGRTRSQCGVGKTP